MVEIVEFLLAQWQALVSLAALVVLIFAVRALWASREEKSDPSDQQEQVTHQQTDSEEKLKELPWREHARGRLELQSTDLKETLQRLEGDIENEARKDSSYSPPAAARMLYWIIIAVYFGAHIVLGYWALVGGLSIIQTVGGLPINSGLLTLLLQIIHLAASIKTVQVDDLAGIDFFGRPIYMPKPGLCIVPYLLLTLTTASRNYRDIRFPGPADRIFRISQEKAKERPGGDVPEEGFVRPIFVTTGEPRFNKEEQDENEEADGLGNPLDSQLNVEISYFVRYRLNEKHGGIFRLIRNIGGVRGKKSDEVRNAIEDLLREQSERDIKSIITQHTTATVIENWALVNEVFALKLQATVLRLGIQIDPNGAGLDDLNPSHETNEAQANVARERFRRSQTVTKAQAEMEKRTLEGQGAANAELARLKALADGYKSISESTKIDGESVIASETLKQALGERADTIVLGTGGVEQLFGLVKAGQGMLKRDGSKPSATTAGDTPTQQGGA